MFSYTSYTLILYLNLACVARVGTKSFSSRTPVVSSHDPHTVTDLHDNGMRFLLHVVAHVSHYVVFYTTLHYLFIHSSLLEFRKLEFFNPMAYIISFDSSSWTQKPDIIRPRYEHFNACRGSSLSLCSLLHNITIAFHSLLSTRVSEFGFFHPMS